VTEHAKRRRLWDRAFTSNAIKSYEPMLQVRLTQLMDSLDARRGQSLDLSAWIGFFSLDFMGDFAFGGAFEMLNHGDDYNGMQELVVTLVSVIEFFGTIPWIRPLLNLSTPPKVRELQQITLEVARKRVAEGSQVRDLFHYLVCELYFYDATACSSDVIAQRRW
jgi:cytochrome P450